ncbi:MAG: stage IV sporulation protein A [Clostridia bacterium]|nr:stage IV sporulation protein A [Clostridia bacterium]
MNSFDIYKDISKRTAGDIYIGVVGPVRTGKSTFIKNFMEKLVIPNIENDYVRTRTQDELPQSAEGSTIMTTEPKFVPNEAVKINMDGNIDLNVRLIDCVGYIVEGASGHIIDGNPRMVSTPWSEQKMPFAQAAELGTQKVIKDHSTIAIVLTSDGTVTNIPRESYINSEARVIKELKELNKPFVIVLNTASPDSESTLEIARQMENKYGNKVIVADCKNLSQEDINNILEEALYQFPVGEIDIVLPKWLEAMPIKHWLKESIISSVKEMAQKITGIRDIQKNISILEENENVKKLYSDNINLGEGRANIEVSLNDNLFYNILSETTGMEIASEYELISMMKQLSEAKREYDKIRFALDEVNKKGYGIVTPSVEEMTISEPQVLKQGNRFGIKIDADAPSIHLIKTNIKTSVAPIVGSEEQSKELVTYLTGQYKDNPQNMWEYSIFGRSLKDLITDDLNAKLLRMPEDTQFKFKETLQKIINEGNGGLICIML